MPSYRYTREIEPEDLQNAPEPEYSNKQKAGNWWHYHWKLVLICAAVLLVALLFLRDLLNRVDPDFTVGILTPYALPEQATTALGDALAPLVGDLNGDGEMLVQVEVYTIDMSEAEDPDGGTGDEPASTPQAEQDASSGEGFLGGGVDPYSQMAGVTKLMAAFETGECVLLMADPAQAQLYQDTYGLFGTPEGDMAPEGSDVNALTRPYADLTGLEGLAFEGMDGAEYGVAELLGDYRVGLRALGGTRLEEAEGGPERWQQAQALLEDLAG